MRIISNSWACSLDDAHAEVREWVAHERDIISDGAALAIAGLWSIERRVAITRFVDTGNADAQDLLDEVAFELDLLNSMGAAGTTETQTLAALAHWVRRHPQAIPYWDGRSAGDAFGRLDASIGRGPKAPAAAAAQLALLQHPDHPRRYVSGFLVGYRAEMDAETIAAESEAPA